MDNLRAMDHDTCQNPRKQEQKEDEKLNNTHEE